MRRLSLLCVRVLEVVEVLRGGVALVNGEEVGSGLLKEVMASVLSVLKALSSLSEEKMMFFEVYENEVTAGLEMMLDILEKCRDRVPNHFGVYEVM